MLSTFLDSNFRLDYFDSETKKDQNEFIEENFQNKDLILNNNSLNNNPEIRTKILNQI